MLRKKLKIAAGLMVLTLLIAVGLVARAKWVLEQKRPRITDTTWRHRRRPLARGGRTRRDAVSVAVHGVPRRT